MRRRVSAEIATAGVGVGARGSGWLVAVGLGLGGLRAVAKVLATIFGATLVTFVVLNSLPGDPAAGLLGMDATPEAVAALRGALRLDEPLHERYWHWLSNALVGDLGDSLVFRQPVWEILARRLPVTLELFGIGLVITIVPAFAVAVLAAVRPNGIVDRMISVMTTVSLALPGFVVALLLVLVFSVWLDLLPPIGYVPFSEDPVENLKRMCLPAIALAESRFAVNARMLRTELAVRIATSDYAMTARAKGMGPFQVLMRHGVRNASFAVIPIIGVNVAPLIGAVVIIEPIFGMPGIGDLLVNSIYNRDAPIVQAAVVMFATLAVLGNLLAEVAGSWFDPRVRRGSDR